MEKIKTREKPEIEKEIEKIFKGEIENIKNKLNEKKENKRIIKEKLKEQKESDMKEILDLEKNLKELQEDINSLKKEK